MRVGIGYDIHRLTLGRKLILGGIEIPYVKGLEGHSDADVFLHSLCDAMLGAAGSNDIGKHFPDTDPQFKGASSIGLLKQVLDIVTKKGFKVNNVDTVIIAEEPKIAPFMENMREKVSLVLKLDKEKINIKASTSEGVGAIGRGEAIASYSVITLEEEVKGKRRKS